jgi:FixJ family two-component response regulator
MDIHMPVMDGNAAIRALMRMKADMPVVAVSGFATYESQAMKAGARMFLAKPYTASQLLVALESVLVEA